jgi:hypothetical protein
MNPNDSLSAERGGGRGRARQEWNNAAVCQLIDLVVFVWAKKAKYDFNWKCIFKNIQQNRIFVILAV